MRGVLKGLGVLEGGEKDREYESGLRELRSYDIIL